MITQSPHFIPGLTFSVIHSIGLDKSTGHVSVFIVSYAIFSLSQNSVFCLFIPLFSQPLETTDFVTVSIVLPFPVCRIVRIL